MYFMVLVDEYSRYVVVRLLRNKSDAFMELTQYVSFVENQTERKLQVLSLDNGELCSNNTKGWAAEKGICLDFTPPGKSGQNGIAESAIRAVDGMYNVKSHAGSGGLTGFLLGIFLPGSSLRFKPVCKLWICPAIDTCRSLYRPSPICGALACLWMHGVCSYRL